jgi:hypothetical protein
MKQILDFFDQFSFKQILSTLLLVTLAIFLPFGFWLNQQTHTYKSRAALEPTPIPVTLAYGELPASSPEIALVAPFSGKVGDEVVIQGKNFGQNPPQSQILFNAAPVGEVRSWQDNEIRFLIPPGAVSGNLTLQIDSWQTVWDKPLTVYTSPSEPKASLQHGRLQLENARGVAKILLWENDLSAPPKEFKFEKPLEVSTWRAPQPVSALNWLVLYDEAGQIIPFWQDLLNF